jgi:hypothetical protein
MEAIGSAARWVVAIAAGAATVAAVHHIVAEQQHRQALRLPLNTCDTL